MDTICGMFRLNGKPVTRAEAEAVARASSPEDRTLEVYVTDGAVALAGRTNENEANAPSDRAGIGPWADLVVIADARLDNRDELRRRLGIVEDRDSVPVGRLIGESYRVWGPRCTEHLVGSFAFAVWDAARGRLFLARDRLGIRPLYYHHEAGTLFGFSSDLQGLLTMPEVPRSPNFGRVADYLTGVVRNSRYTFYDTIERLPPGHRMVVEREEFRIEKYWELEDPREVFATSREEYIEGFRDVFFGAVGRRAGAESEVAAFLSGGLDSSSIVGVLRALRKKNVNFPEVNTYSAVFEQFPECDEEAFIDEVLGPGISRSRKIPSDSIDPLTDLRSFVRLQARPIEGHLVNLGHRLAGAARSNSDRIVLHGHGGDEVLARPLRFWADMAEAGTYGSLFRDTWEELGLVAGTRTGLRYWFSKGPLQGPFGRFMARMLGPSRENEKVGEEMSWDRVLSAEFRDLARRSGSEATDETGAQCHRDLCSHPLQTAALEEYARTGDHHGVRFRFPFWDRQLVEYSLSLPVLLKRRGGTDRYVLRAALEDVLPPSVRDRRGKADFAPVLAHAMDGNRLRTLARSLEPKLRGMVDLATLRQETDGVASQLDQAPERTSMWRLTGLLRVIMVGVWLEELVDGPRPDWLIQRSMNGSSNATNHVIG